MNNENRKSSINTRELVLDMLMEIFSEKEYSHIMMRNVLEKYNYLEETEKAFIKRLTEGTLERKIQLDYVINLYSKTPINKMKPLIRSLLRMSVYQILFMDAVPDSAACNEAVKLAEKRKFGTLKSFVNGVLRTIARQKDQIAYPDPEAEPQKAMSIKYSMPEWIVTMWIAAYGTEKTTAILDALLKESAITIRINENMSQEEQRAFLEALKKQGVIIKQHPYLEYAFLLDKTDRISSLPGFEEGLFTVQDVSSMLVSEVAGIKPGDLILDVCAAPGGKTIHAATKLNHTGQVEARDVSAYKTAYIEENALRMKLDNITIKVWDARETDESLVQSADIVFADIPCSGLGVIGKKRDIKYRLSQDKLNDLIVLQKEILQTVWNYVKPGGILVFSTCTINKEENEEMVRWFLEKFPFTLESLDDYLPQELQKQGGESGFLQLLPGVHETDGFFLARLKRNRLEIG